MVPLISQKYPFATLLFLRSILILSPIYVEIFRVVPGFRFSDNNCTFLITEDCYVTVPASTSNYSAKISRCRVFPQTAIP
jgi:hypothetical protein